MIHTEYQQIPRSERNGPNVLVLAPTRELALQIEKEVAKYSFRGMKAYVLYSLTCSLAFLRTYYSHNFTFHCQRLCLWRW